MGSVTDSLLDGNTEYLYRVLARTGWEGIEVASAVRSGRFYGLEEVQRLPSLANSQVQAVGMALDEQDQLYVAISAISTTTARVMGGGIYIKFSGQSLYRNFFGAIIPARLSPVYLAAGQGRLYVTARTQADSILVGAVQVEGQRFLWSRQVDAGEAFPAGIHVEASGECWMVDTGGMIYRFSSEGAPEAPRRYITKWGRFGRGERKGIWCASRTAFKDFSAACWASKHRSSQKISAVLGCRAWARLLRARSSQSWDVPSEDRSGGIEHSALCERRLDDHATMILEASEIFLGDDYHIDVQVYPYEVAVDLLGGLAAVSTGRHYDQQVQVTVGTGLTPGRGTKQEDLLRMGHCHDPGNDLFQRFFHRRVLHEHLAKEVYPGWTPII